MVGFIGVVGGTRSSRRSRRAVVKVACSDARVRGLELLRSVGVQTSLENLRVVAPEGEEALLDNGFIEVGRDDGGRDICFLPGGAIRAHYHDVDEHFEVTGGEVTVSAGKDDASGKVYKSGDSFVVPGGQVHRLDAGIERGVQMYSPKAHPDRQTVFVEFA